MLKNVDVRLLSKKLQSQTLKCIIVQQSVWHMAKESMPLAAGYVVACINEDTRLQKRCIAKSMNFGGTATPLEIALDIVKSGAPDVVGFSVLGWNYHQFLNIARTLKQYNPNCVIIFGGNHVSHQAKKVFADTESVDVVVNGEGDFTIADMLAAIYLSSPLNEVDGISFRDKSGTVITTKERDRIQDLDVIPSPVLNDILPLNAIDGTFRYDVALMETNRGCPYSCSFCYWGGAIGQKVRTFSLERLKLEAEKLVVAGADTIVLCDANFGMLKQDLEFVEAIVKLKRKYGRPNALETSWAKNKNSTFYKIVSLMQEENLQTSFTIALQTLNDTALERMQRKNMKINDWKELAERLHTSGLDVYAELIWGAPGETYATFLAGYDELSKFVSRIATYPMLLLPNTDYGENREKYGFKTIKGLNDDFDYVLESETADLEEHMRAWRFIFWARLLAENMVLRHTFVAARSLMSVSQSQVILSFADFVDKDDSDLSFEMREAVEKSVADPDSLAPILEICFTDSRFEMLCVRWMEMLLANTVAPNVCGAMLSVMKFDLDTRPTVDPSKRSYLSIEDRVDALGRFWLVETVYEHDVVSLLDSFFRDDQEALSSALMPRRSCAILRFKKGFENFVRSTNHEETAHFVAEVISPSELNRAEGLSLAK